MKGKHWLIVFIILFASYRIYTGLSDMITSRREQEQWTTEDRNILIDKCIRECGANGIKYPELTKAYCKCGNDKVLAKFTKADYLELIKKPADEQIKISLPVFRDCLTEYQNSIKQAEK